MQIKPKQGWFLVGCWLTDGKFAPVPLTLGILSAISTLLVLGFALASVIRRKRA